MRISLLIDGSPLAVLATVMRGLPTDVKREIGKHTKGPAADMWRDELNQHVEDRRQGRLASSGTVGVTQFNVTLRAGGVGSLSSGTPVSAIAKATEFGANADQKILTRSRAGRPYKRRLGPTFGPPRRGGKTAYPAARQVISRVASLWVQTAYRTIYEKIERL